MSREREREADPHRRFHAWLIARGDGEPPRDLALHASVCRECMAEIDAFDLLTAIDTGLAPLAPSRPAIGRRSGAVRAVRFAGAAAGLLVVAAVSGIGLDSALNLGLSPWGGRAAGTPVQEVLGNVGGPAISGSVSPTATATPSPTPTR